MLAGGLFFTSLLGGFLLILAGRASTIARVVDERTSDLSAANAQLGREVAERMKAEEGLRRARDELEARVKDRTAELVRANRDLQLEVQERKLAEAALRTSESRFRAVFQASAIGIAVGDPEGRLLEVNDYVGEMLGVSRQTLLGRSLDDFLSPAPTQRPARAPVPNAACSPTAESERRFRTPDERFGWALLRRTPLLDPAGDVR